MSFKMPTSSQPSTPGKASRNSNGNPLFTAEHPSTTPAGPPRSHMFSTTPAVPPPSTVFGSSALGSGTSLFANPVPGRGNKMTVKSSFKVSPKTAFASGRSAKTATTAGNAKPAFLGAHRVQQPEPNEAEYEDTEGDEYSDEDDEDAEGEEEEEEEDDDDSEDEEDDDEDEEDAEGEDDEDEDDENEDEEEEYAEGEGEDMIDEQPVRSLATSFQPRKPDFLQSTGAAFDWEGLAQEDNVRPSPKGLKRSRGFGTTSLIQSIEADLPPAKRRESTLPRIARDLAKSHETAHLDDPDELILRTEAVVKKLHEAATGPSMGMHYEERLGKAWAEVPSSLVRTWSVQAKELEQDDENLNSGIGPAEDSDPVTKAAFVTSMLLPLHHQPHARKPASTNALQRSLSNSTALLSLTDDAKLPYPRVLRDFLENNHGEYGEALRAIAGYRPNATASPGFWDAVGTATLRGRLSLVIDMLQQADFGYAWTAKDEGQRTLGYQGLKARVIDQVIGKLMNVLRSSPAMRDNDWDVTNHDWHLFRKGVERALAELSETAHGASTTNGGPHFGLKAPHAKPISLNSGDGQLPRTIYDSIKCVYNILLGSTTEIIATSQDWLEATLGLAIWWNGEDDSGVELAGLKASRRSAHGWNPAGKQRIVDTDPAAAYRRRLALAVDIVTNGPEDESLMVDTSSSVEVALASVFEGDVEGVLVILQTWSLPITSAVLEVAKWGGWYHTPPTDAPPEGFDDSDLMVLSYAKPDRGLVKDDVLLSYSDHLFEKATVRSIGGESKEGWELAIEVSSRLDDEMAARKRVDWILSRVPLHLDGHAQKIIQTCRKYGLAKQARATAKRYADHVASTSHRYGSAIVYYAIAHEAQKCREVLNLLISMCLVRSRAYPVFEEEKDADGTPTDTILPILLANPKYAMEHLESLLGGILDDDAAEILADNLSGYATLRRYYDLRDEVINPNASSGKKSGFRLKARRRVAVKALLACIASAADSIQGGLYDREAENVVEHDVLLALLAEASEFIGANDRPLTMEQLMLVLRTIEDLQTVHSKIRKQCEECFSACLDAKYSSGSDRLDPKEMLKKSVSGATESSGFSLVGSEITGSSDNGGGQQQPRSDKVKRGWDWRERVERNTTGDELLARLRRNIAEEVAAIWIEEL